MPPFLGYQTGEHWVWASLGFVLSAVIIPILAIFGYARIQKSFLGFSAPLGPIPSVIFGMVLYAIAITLPCPRTASVTYEMSVAPYFEFSSLLFSLLYFGGVLVFALNRSKILDVIGKYLTPLIVLLLLCIIVLGFFLENPDPVIRSITNPMAFGFVEGYQTFDAIGGVVVGGVVLVTLALNKNLNYQDRKKIIAQSGIIAGLGLILIYIGLIILGSHQTGVSFETRTELLTTLSRSTLGGYGTMALAILVALACFTTAVGIVVGMADFVSELFGNSRKAFVVATVGACLIGVLIGQFSVPIIISLAVPALLFIYPITIVLVLINALPNRYHQKRFYRIGVTAAVVFSLPEFVYSMAPHPSVERIRNWLPLGEYNLGWLLPTLLLLLLLGILMKNSNFNRGRSKI